MHHKHAKMTTHWQVIKAAINRKKYYIVYNKFKVHVATTNDGNVIANKSNTFFVNVGTISALDACHPQMIYMYI